MRLNAHEDSKQEFLEIFEASDSDYQNEKSFFLYSKLWIVAFEIGKLSLAKKFSQKYYNYILEHKRVPALKKFISDLDRLKFQKSKKHVINLNTLLGKIEGNEESNLILSLHPETFKNSKEDLKNYLIFEPTWTDSHWKLAYEFVLRYYYDEQVFLSLFEKTIEAQKEEHHKIFESKLAAKKINLSSYQYKQDTKEKLSHFDDKSEYTLNNLAYSIFSGDLQTSTVNQEKIIQSFSQYEWEKEIAQAHDMIVAFGFLGMDQVVIYLCENYLKYVQDVKSKISLIYLLTEAMFNSGHWHKCIDLAEDTLGEYPLLQDEKIAFNYTRAESYFCLKKYSRAKSIYMEIKKYNSHYRLVAERLKAIEKIK